MMVSGKPFIENFKWKSDKGTRFTIVSRADGKIVDNYLCEPFFAFHHVNAFERENKVVIDLVAYDDSSIISSFYLDVLKGDGLNTIPTSTLRRYSITLNSGSIEYEPIHQMLEFPHINYKRYNMKEYNFLYAAGLHSVGDLTNRLIKVDVKSRDFNIWSERGCHPGEPVFVPKPGSTLEDDGLILSVVLDSKKKNSFLLVLSAQTFEEIARAEVPHHIPYGFHGQYYGDIN
jgi:beta,beta-carotene 9',10'-dioxygenase